MAVRGQAEGRTQAARRGEGGRRYVPRETARAKSALPGSAPDGRGPPQRHGRRRSGAQPEAEEREQAGA
eukprot:4876733-Pleurochrysis_carterae.AAC.1